MDGWDATQAAWKGLFPSVVVMRILVSLFCTNSWRTRAIQLATQAYTEDPTDHQNTFNLALYHLVAGQKDKAQQRYQEPLTQNASIDRIRAAIQDLEALLTLFPKHPQALHMRGFLQSILGSRNQSSHR